MIAILGGAFNPPHLGHLQMAMALKEKYPKAKIYLMPNGSPPHKKSLAFEKRLAMLEILKKEYKFFDLLLVEQDQSITHYTYNTLTMLKEKHEELVFAMGMDSFHQLLSWHKGDKIVDLSKLMVFKRSKLQEQDFSLDLKSFINSHKERIDFCDHEICDISSTLLRDFLHQGIKEHKSYSELHKIKPYSYLHPKVLAYILEHKLY